MSRTGVRGGQEGRMEALAGYGSSDGSGDEGGGAAAKVGS